MQQLWDGVLADRPPPLLAEWSPVNPQLAVVRLCSVSLLESVVNLLQAMCVCVCVSVTF